IQQGRRQSIRIGDQRNGPDSYICNWNFRLDVDAAVRRSMKTQSKKKMSRGEAGTSLIEVMVALAILMIVSVGILSMALISMTTTENQGHLAARTTEYAQDKMEQLLGLSFADGSGGAGLGTDTTAIDTATNSYTLGTGG